METWESDTEFVFVSSRFHGEMVTCLCVLHIANTYTYVSIYYMEPGAIKYSVYQRHTFSCYYYYTYVMNVPKLRMLTWTLNMNML